MFKVAALALIATLIAYGVHAVAQTRVDLRPAVMPIGSSSSDGMSFAWFYDASNRAVYVCRTGKGIAAVECKGSATLP